MTLPEHARQPLGPNQERWIQALESGKYMQGRRMLRNNSDGFCCLGVACEVLGMKARLRGGAWFYSNKDGLAPPSVIRKLALRDDTGMSSDDALERHTLTGLNDDGKSFSEIAAIIRSDPSVYFKEPR